IRVISGNDCAFVLTSVFPFSVSEFPSRLLLEISLTLFSDSPWRMMKYLLPLFLVCALSSSREPMTVTLPVPSFHIGSGLAQKRLREMVQSGAVSRLCLKRPSFKCSGNHEILLFSVSSCFLIA